jgi:hypothetical protein
MLVSWTRLLAGRARDPLVGRDVLIGGTAGVLIAALGILVVYAGGRFGLTQVPTLISSGMLTSLTGLADTGCNLSYAGSVCVLQVLEMLVLVLVIRLLLRRTDLAVGLTMALIAGVSAMEAVPTNGWPIAVVGAVLIASIALVMMRFGLLAGVTAAFFGIVMSSVVPTLDLASWYADRALVPAALLVTVLGFGAVVALGGKPIFSDPLRETVRRSPGV